MSANSLPSIFQGDTRRRRPLGEHYLLVSAKINIGVFLPFVKNVPRSIVPDILPPICGVSFRLGVITDPSA